MPLSGWLLNAAAGYPLQWFGLFNVPRLIARDEALHELAEGVHEIGFWVLLVLVHGSPVLRKSAPQREAPGESRRPVPG